MTGFNRLHTRSVDEFPSRAGGIPTFDRLRDGFVVGEGPECWYHLEEREHALKSGAPILVELVGFGLTGDVEFMTE